jgi:hypothetical protein
MFKLGNVCVARVLAAENERLRKDVETKDARYHHYFCSGLPVPKTKLQLPTHRPSYINVLRRTAAL